MKQQQRDRQGSHAAADWFSHRHAHAQGIYARITECICVQWTVWLQL